MYRIKCITSHCPTMQNTQWKTDITPWSDEVLSCHHECALGENPATHNFRRAISHRSATQEQCNRPCSKITNLQNVTVHARPARTHQGTIPYAPSHNAPQHNMIRTHRGTETSKHVLLERGKVMMITESVRSSKNHSQINSRAPLEAPEKP